MSLILIPMLAQLYKPSLALLTDLYQLTMAYGYWKLGVQNKQAVFHLYFRNNPVQGGYLSIETRKILDEAGLPDTKIMASNDLDETLIESLKQQGAKIAIWGVGTHLATAYDQPARGGVYKLGAIRNSADGPWEYKIKLSEQTAKTSIPGIQQVRRFSRAGQFIGDAIYNEPFGVTMPATIVDPRDIHRFKTIPDDAEWEDLLAPVFRGGKRAYDVPGIHDARKRAMEQVQKLHPSIKRFANPHEYPAGLDQRLSELRTELMLKSRGTQ